MSQPIHPRNDYCFNNTDDNEDTGDFSSYWQSIPDPPSFADDGVTSSNNELVVCNDGNNNEHVPSTTTTTEHLVQSTLTNSVSSKTAAASGKVIKKRLRDVTNHHQQQSSVARKKKQRRSFLLPSDNIDSSAAAATTATDSKPSSSCISSSQHDALITTNNGNITNDKQTQQRLIQLVREYCALPDNHQRVSSQQAREIERLSNYPMPGKKFHLPMMQVQQQEATNEQLEPSCNDVTNDAAAAEDNDTTSNNKHNQIKATYKQELLLHLKPIVQEMEHRKQTDTLESRSATHCEMYRHKGRCCYFDVDSGDEVDSREYERRYLKWIEERRMERLDGETTRRKMDDVGRGNDEFGNSSEGGECDEESVLSSPSPPLLLDVACHHCESSFEMDQSVDMDDSVMSMSSAASPPDEAISEMDLKNAASTAPVSVLAAADAANNARDDSKTDRSARDDTTHNASSSSRGSSMLGLPSLPPSNDTRVMEARAKLWRAIDVALENYSREIIAIQQGSN